MTLFLHLAFWAGLLVAGILVGIEWWRRGE